MSIHVSGVGGWDGEEMGHVNVRIPTCVNLGTKIGGLPCFSHLKSSFSRPRKLSVPQPTPYQFRSIYCMCKNKVRYVAHRLHVVCASISP